MTVRYQNFFAEQTLARLPNVFSASGYAQGRRKVMGTAEQRSRRNVYYARSKLIQMALNRFTAMCYERFDGRLLANVDPTGKVRIGVPRAWRNCHSYGINRNDADYLRWEMMGRCLPELEHISLFCLYGNRWHLDLHAYPTEADAFRYWEDFPVTASTLAGFELVRKQVRE